MIKILTFKNFLLITVLTLFSILAVSLASPGGSVSAQSDQQAEAAAQDARDAQLKRNACAGSNFNLDGNGGNCQEGAGESQLNAFINRAVNIFSIVVGIIAVIMVIVGGLKFITSGGDSGRVSSARQTIIYAIIGLIIVALAQIIVRFVLGQTI